MPHQDNLQPQEDSLVDLYDQLIARQRYSEIIFATIIGVCIGFVLVLLIERLPIIWLVNLVVPGVIAGYSVKYWAFAWEWKYRIVCGLVVFSVLTLLPVVLLDTSSVFYYVFGIPNAVVATAVSKRHLTPEERKEIYRRDYGVDKA